MMETFVGIVLVLFGLIVGSFFNSFVWRFGRRQPHPTRSVCVHCKKPIAWYDNIPLVSFILLSGKCRRCKKSIPWHYPVVEAGTSFVFLLPLLVFGQAIVLLPVLALTFFLVVLFLLDLRYSVLPDTLTFPAMLAALLTSIFLGRTLLDVALGVAIGAGIFLLQYVLSRGRWIGDGDIRFGCVIGLALGWKYTVLALLLAYWFGALIGLILLATKRKTMNSSLPFGTFLSFSTYSALLFGDTIFHWLTTLWLP